MPTFLKIEDRQTGYTYNFAPDNTTYFWTNFNNNTISLISLPGVDSGFDPYVGERGATAKGSIQGRVMLTAPDGGTYQTRLKALNQMLIDLNRVVDMGLIRLWVQFDGTPSAYYNDCKIQNVTIPQSAKSHDDLFIEVGLFFSTENTTWINPGGAFSTATYGGGFTYGSGVRYGSNAPIYAASGTSTDLSINYSGNATSPCRIVVACGASQVVTTLKIRRLVNSAIRDEVDYPTTLANNDTLTINCVESEITKNGSSAYDTSFDYLHPDWFRLAPGMNDIQVILGDAGDACSVQIEYNEVIRR